MSTLRTASWSTLSLAISTALAAPATRAATIDVDHATCTIGNAIASANTDSAVGGCTAGSGRDTLRIVANLDNGFVEPPPITTDMAIVGAFGVRTLIANEGGPLFMIGAAGPFDDLAPSVELRNLSLTGARIGGVGGPGGGSAAGMGGAVFVYAGTVSILDVRLVGAAIGGAGTSRALDGTHRGGAGGGGIGGIGGAAGASGANGGAGLLGANRALGGGGGGGGSGTVGGTVGGNGGGPNAGTGSNAALFNNPPATAGGFGGGGGGGGGSSQHGDLVTFGAAGGFGGGGGGAGAFGEVGNSGGAGGFGGGGGGGGDHATSGTVTTGGAGGFGGSGGSGGNNGTLPGNLGAAGFGAGSGEGGFTGGAAGLGGALFVRSGTVDIRASALDNSTATGGSGTIPGQGLGGAVFVLHTLNNTNGNQRGMPSSLPVVTGCGNTFSGNNATSDAGTDTNNNDVFGVSLASLTDACPGELRVSGNGIAIANGDTTPSLADHTDFGSVPAAGANAVTRTFTLENTGFGPLAFSESGLGASFGFTLVQAPPATLAPQASAPMVVRFDPTLRGIEEATAFLTADNASFTWRVTGNGANTPPTIAGPDPAALVLAAGGAPANLQLAASDPDTSPPVPDVPDVLAWSIATPPSAGTASIGESSGLATYQAQPAFVGATSFVVSVSDGGSSDTVTVLVEVRADALFSHGFEDAP